MYIPPKIEYGAYLSYYDFERQDSGRYSRDVKRHFAHFEQFYTEMRATIFETLQANGPGSAKHGSDDLNLFNQCGDELDWFNNGKPYYKIDPWILPHLSSIPLTLPCEHLVFPFEAFEIRLPKDQFKENDKAPWVRGMLVCVYRKEDLQEAKQSGMVSFNTDADTDLLVLRIDVGPEEFTRNDPETGLPITSVGEAQFFIRFKLKPGTSVIDCYRQRRSDMEKMQGYIPDSDFCEKCIAIAVGTAMVACRNEEMIAPDLPRKLIERYYIAKKGGDEQKLAEINRKRLKVGMGKGWIVGMEDSERPVIITEQGEQKGPLQYGHWRSPHARLQPYGPRLKPTYRLIFIPASRVRKDLPLKHSQAEGSA